MGLVKPKKFLGQHFLKDLSIAKDIADTVDECPGLPILEVGPGMGVLTQFLMEKGREVKVVELDFESVAYLRENFPALEGNIIEDDFLKLKLEKLWAIFRDNAAFIAGTMFVMAPSKATGQVFAYLNITKIIANFMFSISTNPYIVLCMIFVIMFIVGMFVQTTPAIVILAPTLLAVVSQVGIDPIHFGIIMTLALAIAFVTPPVALNLFVGSSMTGLSIDKIVRAFMPFLIGLIVAFFIVSFVPAISLGVLGDWSLTFG